MPPNRFESEVESFLEGSHGDRTHIKRADHPRLHHYAGRYSHGPPSDQAGRTFSRTRRDNVATLKPTTPLHTAKQQPLKPTTPMQPKNAPKTPISHLQRRRRFQLRLDQHPQRRWRFQSHTNTSGQRRRRFQPHTGTITQRRQRFQTSGPPGRQSLTTAPAGGGWAWPGDRWAANVTNVVKPTRFTSPLEGLCYIRRQSASKNLDFQRKSRRIDDVCNNGSEIHTKNTSD